MTEKKEAINEKDLILRKSGLNYKKYAKVPFTGVGECFHENGKLNKRRSFKYGKLNGLSEEFTLFGDNPFHISAIICRANYKNGKEHGLSEWFHDNGQLKNTGNFKNGVAHGLQEHYWHGELWVRENYKDGKLDGLFEHYYENGQLESRGAIKMEKKKASGNILMKVVTKPQL